MGLLKRPTSKFVKVSGQVSVMQWNTLADSLAFNFPAVRDEDLQWAQRSSLILAEIQRASADILCLQEVDHFSDFFYPNLQKLGYEGVFKKKKDWHEDGVCIFYKDSYKKLQDFEISFPGNQVAIGLLLQYEKQLFYVFSTHLKSYSECNSIRDEQVTILLEFLSKLENYPMIVCGDFNSSPSSTAYVFMFNNGLGLSSVYRKNNEPEFTTVKQREILK